MRHSSTQNRHQDLIVNVTYTCASSCVIEIAFYVYSQLIPSNCKFQQFSKVSVSVRHLARMAFNVNSLPKEFPCMS